MPSETKNQTELFKDPDETVGFSLNEDYSKKYSDWRQKEELSKLKSKYGDLKLDEDSSDSYVEDFDSETEKEFLRTYSLLKQKDKRIYDPDFVAFTKPIVGERRETTEKPFTLKDAEIEYALAGDPEEDTKGEKVVSREGDYETKLRECKELFKKHGDEIENDGVEFLKIKKKSEKAKKEDEDSYRLWLKGKDIPMDNKLVQDINYLRDYWSNPQLDEDEKCLKYFVLDQPYKQSPSTASSSPSESSSDEADLFERKYNFRFQEPDPEFIKQYPRTIAHSVRKKDERRKQKRLERRERKAKEKEHFLQEIKRMNALKRKDLEQRLDALKAIAGDEKFGLGIEDLDRDEFDPNEHDKRMQEVFNDDYYALEESKERPEVEDEDLNEIEQETLYETHDPTLDEERVQESVRSRRKRRKEKKKATYDIILKLREF
ncbi:hypothetical protein ACOME3_010651 [Neoechinorhynchus agilis]